MTPDRACELAQYQRPGVKLVVGPTEAREEVVKPLWYWHVWQLPGDASWWHRDARLRLGFEPHPVGEMIGRMIEETTGDMLSVEDWMTLQNGSQADREGVARRALAKKEAAHV